MRIPKFLLAVFAATVCAGFISVRADDNPAQAAARAALEQKMHELDAQSSQTNATPSAPQNEAPSAQPAPSVSTEQTPVTSAAAVSTPPAMPDAEAQERAQAALDQKMRELDEQSSQTNATPAAPVMVNSSGAVVVVMQTNQPSPAMTSPATPESSVKQPAQTSGSSSLFEPAAPSVSNTEAQSAADAALQQKMAELNQEQPAQFQPVPAAQQGSSGATYSGK